jgi:hypothetical protein
MPKVSKDPGERGIILGFNSIRIGGLFISRRFCMTALVMQKLANALFDEGFVVKKIEDEQKSSFDRFENGEKYTGHILIVVRPKDEEEAEAEAARFRKIKEREFARGIATPSKPGNEEVRF